MSRTAYLDSLPTNMENRSVIHSIRNPIEQRQSFWYYPLFERFYLQFLLVTTLYVMEPWERLLMISIFFLVISLVSYSAFVYIPFHFDHLLQSTIPSLMNISMK